MQNKTKHNEQTKDSPVSEKSFLKMLYKIVIYQIAVNLKGCHDKKK